MPCGAYESSKAAGAELQFLPGVTGAVIPRVCDAIKSNPEGIPKWSEAELSGVLAAMP